MNENGGFLDTFHHASYDWDPMDLVTVDSEPMMRALPQLVPDSACVRCDVCCRFPEADSFLRPYFTAHEIADAVAHGVADSSFPDKSGSQVNLVKNPVGEGYLCPAFDSTVGRCGIYDVRPLDCQLYPLALMWDASGEEVLLGWDTKCPSCEKSLPVRFVRMPIILQIPWGAMLWSRRLWLTHTSSAAFRTMSSCSNRSLI